MSDPQRPHVELRTAEALRADSAVLIARDWQIHQSNNQDWNTESVYDVATGTCIDSKSWWDNDRESPAPRELAPGISVEDGQLRVGSTTLALPIDAIVCRTERGEILVAGVHGRRLELYALKTGIATGGRSPRAP